MQIPKKDAFESTNTLKQTCGRVINGAIAGVVGTCAIFPLDLSKTRLQQQSKLSTGGVLYRNVFDCMVKVCKHEGFKNLYKGLAVNLLFVMPEKAIKLCVNDQMRHNFGSRGGSVLPLQKEMLAGAIAGTCQVIVTTPMEFLKIQMQMANKSASGGAKAESALQLASKIIKKDGFFSIYRGLTATFFRDVIFSLLYFPGFAILNNKGYGIDGSKPAFYHTLMSGLISGCFSALAVTPLDVIKTRLQFIDNTSKSPLYNGILDCTIKTYRNDGISAFFRGAIPRMVVIAPLFGIAQTVYFLGIGEKLLTLLD